MTDVRDKTYSPKIAAKREAKRKELVKGALYSLAEHGYAETGLRKIASDLGVSLGVLHYHFENKNDLIIQCARHYTDRFVLNMMSIIQMTDGDVLEGLVDFVTKEVEQHYKIHRLWYDIQAQSLYVRELRPIVLEFEETFIFLAKALVQMNEGCSLTPTELYVLFERMLLKSVRDRIEERPDAKARLINELLELNLKLTGEQRELAEFLPAE